MSRVPLQRLFYAAAAAFVTVAGGVALFVSPQTLPVADPITTAALSPSGAAVTPSSAVIGLDGQGLFLLTRDDGSDLCVFEALAPEREGLAPIRVDDDCAGLYPALESAALWRSLPSGDVRIENADGDLLLGFAPTETEDLISVSPRSASFTLSRL